MFFAFSLLAIFRIPPYTINEEGRPGVCFILSCDTIPSFPGAEEGEEKEGLVHTVRACA